MPHFLLKEQCNACPARGHVKQVSTINNQLTHFLHLTFDTLQCLEELLIADSLGAVDKMVHRAGPCPTTHSGACHAGGMESHKNHQRVYGHEIAVPMSQ